MQKTFIFGVLVLLFFSCKQNKTNVDQTDTSAFDITTEKWPKKANVNSKATNLLKNWPEYNALETSFDALYTVENIEDLSLVLEDLIEKQKLLAASTYPVDFDEPQIKSRQKVFHTFLLKVKGNIEYQLDVEEPVLAMINAHNALLSQFNVIMNRIDINTLLDEEE